MANVKAEKLNAFLEERNITSFAVEELKDQLNTVVYRSHLAVAGQQLPFIIVTDDSIYTMMQTQIISSAVKEEKKLAVLEYLNGLNERFKSFKYTVNANGDVVLTVCIPVSGEQFEGALAGALIDVILNHLETEYPEMMKKIWAE